MPASRIQAFFAKQADQLDAAQFHGRAAAVHEEEDARIVDVII